MPGGDVYKPRVSCPLPSLRSLPRSSACHQPARLCLRGQGCRGSSQPAGSQPRGAVPAALTLTSLKWSVTGAHSVSGLHGVLQHLYDVSHGLHLAWRMFSQTLLVEPLKSIQLNSHRNKGFLPFRLEFLFSAIFCVDKGLPWWLGSKESAHNAGDAGDPGSVPGSGRSPGGGLGIPLQSSCLKNPLRRGAWRAAVCGIAESDRLTVHRDESMQGCCRRMRSNLTDSGEAAAPWPRGPPACLQHSDRPGNRS